MYLKIAQSKTGSLYLCLGYYKYDLFIGLTYDKRNILDYLDVIGFDIPRSPSGEYELGVYYLK